LYVIHFEALLGLAFGGLSVFASFVLFLAFATLPEPDAESDLVEQFLLVQWLFITIDPQVQNCAKRITP
jgi:hypothetical protein